LRIATRDLVARGLTLERTTKVKWREQGAALRSPRGRGALRPETDGLIRKLCSVLFRPRYPHGQLTYL